MLVVPAQGVAQAYAAGKLSGIQAASTVAAPKRGDFSRYVENAVRTALNTVRQGEHTAAAGMQGKASAQEVVQAVMSAEMTVQSVVAVRDKLVSAYLDIMRMPI
ncbi:flagellar hook-basal body complex protein FliE [Indioceanicola profundi]|uniref:flagellar hook-basal body complex protein FliE n=1 Tax=Indioceanicola profundi TaxID=2220096 RepID=UPI000E6ABB20|nr:flagellar hook-basal body complex protein FliE [Indioceanicola profundi]